MKNKAFTLAEVLITLSIIGVIIAVTVPGLIKGVRPNNNKLLFKKAYFTLEQTVANLINDETLYSDSYDSSGNLVSGFKNTNEAGGCKETAGEKKFECLFKKQLNLIEENAKCTNKNTNDCFEASDGIIWKIEDSFNTSDEKSTVIFDINGTKGPNSNDFDTFGKNRDIFSFIIHSDGRIEVPNDDQTKDYLRSTNAMN